MGNDGGVSAAARKFDALERFSQSPDLVQFDENGIGDAFLNSFLEDFRIGYKDVITNELNSVAQPFCRLPPAAPVVFGQAVFQGIDSRVTIEPVFPDRGKKRKEKREFATMTRDLLALADWLQRCGVTHVAMESTGVYWKPVWNILEGQFEVLLVNAQHIKAVPGRKTDQNDAEWIADLLQHGLARSSFVPPTPIRELRDLTRYRVCLVQECNRIANRIQKVLEDANIKLASVATDALGASGRAMLKAMMEGEEDAEKLAEMSRGLLRNKIPELQRALEGRMKSHHRFLLKELMEHLEFVESPRLAST
jgi:Transposase